MGLLTKISLNGSESNVQRFQPGDNITFVTQPDGSIKINGEAGGGGGGGGECHEYSLEWDQASNSLVLKDDGTQVGTLELTGIGGGGGTVDSAMSDSSENAVQNKAIKAYVDAGLATKQNNLTSENAGDGIVIQDGKIYANAAFTISGGSLSSQTVEAGSRKAFAISNVAPTGYEIAAYRQISIAQGTGDSTTNWQKCFIQFFSTTGGGRNAQVSIANTGTANASINITVNCLCVKV